MSLSLANPFRQALQEGRQLVGGWAMSGSETVVEALGYAGYDFIVLDIEHSPTTVHGVVGLLRAMGESGTVPVVRMPSQDGTAIKHVLDLGALTVYFPFVNTAGEAQAIVRNAMYWPRGIRGFARMHRGSRYTGIGDYVERVNDELFLIAQLETPEGLDNLEAIAAVEGISGLFVGPGDLSACFGLAGNIGHDKVRNALEDAAARAAKVGLPIGTVLGTPEMAAWAFRIGYSFVSIANDLANLVAASRQQIAQVRAAMANRPAGEANDSKKQGQYLG